MIFTKDGVRFRVGNGCLARAPRVNLAGAIRTELDGTSRHHAIDERVLPLQTLWAVRVYWSDKTGPRSDAIEFDHEPTDSEFETATLAIKMRNGIDA